MIAGRKLYRFLMTTALAGLLLSGCKRTAVEPEPPAPITIRSEASYPWGAAVTPTHLANNAPYIRTARNEYDRITPENHMKMSFIHPEPGRYDWTGSDIVANFARQNGQKLHGHTLIWHQSVPDWVLNFDGDSTAWENLFRSHIQTVVAKYRGVVSSWDVVNEAFEDDGTLRNTIWLQKLGPGYIARAFQYARETDPAALLFYNDYGQEYKPAKMRAIVALATEFRRNNIPLDGLGIQMHIELRTDDAGIATALRESASTGLLVHISELDIALNINNDKNFQPNDALFAQQARKYANVVRAYRQNVPPAQRHGITTWNVGDADSWLLWYKQAPEFPLPFDVNYERKPAYQAILDALN